MPPPYGLTWWIGLPPEAWTQRCVQHFDVRRSRKFKDARLRRAVHSTDQALKIGQFRSGAATAGKISMKLGLGISDLKERR